MILLIIARIGVFAVFMKDFERDNKYVIRVENTVILGITEIFPAILLAFSFIAFGTKEGTELDSVDVATESLRSLNDSLKEDHSDDQIERNESSQNMSKYDNDINRTVKSSGLTLLKRSLVEKDSYIKVNDGESESKHGDSMLDQRGQETSLYTLKVEPASEDESKDTAKFNPDGTPIDPEQSSSHDEADQPSSPDGSKNTENEYGFDRTLKHVMSDMGFDDPSMAQKHILDQASESIDDGSFIDRHYDD